MTLELEGSVGNAAVDLQFSGSVVVAEVCHETVCWSDAQWDEEGELEVIIVDIVRGVESGWWPW